VLILIKCLKLINSIREKEWKEVSLSFFSNNFSAVLTLINIILENIIMDGGVSAFIKASKDPRYEGKWVVILKNKVVFSGKAEELKKGMNYIRKKHPNAVPLIAKVPKKIAQIV